MDIPTRQDIKKIVIAGDKKKHSHVIIYLDRFDYTYESRYVEKDEDIDEVIAKLTSLSSHSMITIIEVYNYALDLNSQLHEQRAYHLEPRPPRVIVSQAEIAKDFATLMHQGQLRRDGSEYINHPTRVAEYVKKYKQSKSLDILEASGYLHDTVEDTETTYYDLVDIFGPLIAHIVMELTTDEDMKEALGKTRYLTLKMKNMSSWARTLKLLDRLDNVSDLDDSDEEFRTRYTGETISIIAFLVNARVLNETQLRIVKDIIARLSAQTRLKPEEKARLGNIIIPEKRIAFVNNGVHQN